MKKTKKMLVLLMVVIMACSLFMTGCGGKDNETDGDSSTLVIAIQEEVEGTDIHQIGCTSELTLRWLRSVRI